MIRSFFYSVFVLIALTGNVWAQTPVGVRTAEHDGYSRLVIDWAARPSYTVRKDGDDTLVVNFESAANLKNNLSSPPAGYIKSFKVLSEDPLSLSLSFTPGARTRHFGAGDRVVIDVYAVDGEAPAKITASAPAPVSDPAPAVQPEPEEKPEEPAKLAHAAANEPQTGHASAHGEAEPHQEDSQPPSDEDLKALVDEHSTKEHGEDHKQVSVLEAASARLRPGLVSFSSTKAQGLAAFELNGKLWLVNDQEDLVLIPQISGPGAAGLKPLEELKGIEGGKVYKANIPEGSILRGQGGGLVWRVIASSDKPKDKPVAPVREGTDAEQARAGKLVWPLGEGNEILRLTDPVSGAQVIAVTVQNAKMYAGPAYDFVDFKTLPSPVGLAIVPKVDDLEVKLTKAGVEISRPSGLALQTPAQLAKIAAEQKRSVLQPMAQQIDERRIFDFESWNMGGIAALNPNKVIMLSTLQSMSDEDKIEALVTLAKMYLSNAQGAEALGFLRFAESLLPDLDRNAEFIALRGAAKAINDKSEAAFIDLSENALKPFNEIGYWRAYALADLEDWAQAKSVLPESLYTLYTYPPLIFDKLALVLAEIELRSGAVDRAEALLKRIEENEESLFEGQKAALDYLKGEAARQRGDTRKTQELWEALVTGPDDLYRAKAGLALSRLLVNENKLSSKEAIDQLERLRYAWRGDGLEAQIYYWMGRTYFEAGEYARALNILREAASVAAGTDFGTRIAAEMSEIFTDLFLSEKLKDVPPPEAAALYEQFSELVPIGTQGDKVVEILAEHLVQADMLERASSLLSHQLQHRLTGEEAYRVGTRLSGIYLLNGKPQQALEALAKAREALGTLPEEMQTEGRKTEMTLLRARALSQENRPDQALKLLETLDRTPSVNRLRADIAWNAAYWDDAADAFGDVVQDENISLTRPLNDEDARLLLNWAVTLNLAADRVGLANMREKYSDAMAQTDKARLFEVVTRPRQSAALADRETLMGIVSEVDLFGDFLNSYRTSNAPTN